MIITKLLLAAQNVINTLRAQINKLPLWMGYSVVSDHCWLESTSGPDLAQSTAKSQPHLMKHKMLPASLVFLVLCVILNLESICSKVVLKYRRLDSSIWCYIYIFIYIHWVPVCKNFNLDVDLNNPICDFCSTAPLRVGPVLGTSKSNTFPCLFLYTLHWMIPHETFWVMLR